ncbi:MAG: serine/threonine protein kinase [Gemmatimonadetes bacterium]|nr:serine/threonine protein kinase [Gemmatimonadota bacterium]
MRCPRCGAIYQPPARFCIKDGFPLVIAGQPDPPGLHRTGDFAKPGAGRDLASGLVGRVIDGRYALEKRVGEGGMAYVYRAADRQTGGIVAIKVLMSRLAGDAESVARLRREAQLATKLNHPNCCGLLGYGEANGLPYLVMPFLEGETLATRENRVGPMAAELAVPIVIQLCRGLQHAHDAGILHRDLKPENIMLVPDRGVERAVVMDFGLAKESLFGSDPGKLTATGIVLGTPEFMSPEQIRGKQIDQRSDVYALGVLAFELLTGTLPFEGKNAQETMLNHLQGRPKRLRAVRSDLSESLEHVLDRALRADPVDRYRSMTEFAEALGRIL